MAPSCMFMWNRCESSKTYSYYYQLGAVDDKTHRYVAKAAGSRYRAAGRQEM